RHTTGIAHFTWAGEAVAADLGRTRAGVGIRRRDARARASGRVGAVALFAELLHVVAARRIARAVRQTIAGAVRRVRAVAFLWRSVLDAVAAERCRHRV